VLISREKGNGFTRARTVFCSKNQGGEHKAEQESVLAMRLLSPDRNDENSQKSGKELVVLRPRPKAAPECLLIHELREGFLAGVPLCSHEGKLDLGEQKMPWLGSTLGEKNQTGQPDSSGKKI
jgi:hypothetical protein